jgi:hypothetical protein
MRAKLSCYALVGIDAVPVDVIVDGDLVNEGLQTATIRSIGTIDRRLRFRGGEAA